MRINNKSKVTTSNIGHKILDETIPELGNTYAYPAAGSRHINLIMEKSMFTQLSTIFIIQQHAK